MLGPTGSTSVVAGCFQVIQVSSNLRPSFESVISALFSGKHQIFRRILESRSWATEVERAEATFPRN